MNRSNPGRVLARLLAASFFIFTLSTAYLSAIFAAPSANAASSTNNQNTSDSFDSPPSSDSPNLTNAPININVASTAVLAHSLKGIGPSKAEAIVRYREEHGAFQTVDELVNVKGIGPKTLDKLRSQIVAGDFIEPEAGQSLAEQESAAVKAVQAIVKRSLEIRKAVDTDTHE